MVRAPRLFVHPPFLVNEQDMFSLSILPSFFESVIQICMCFRLISYPRWLQIFKKGDATCGCNAIEPPHTHVL